MSQYVKDLIELGNSELQSNLDNYFLSMLIANELDLQNDMEDDSDSEYDSDIHQQLKILWESKYKQIYNFEQSNSYHPPYYGEDHYPYDWMIFMMEKAPIDSKNLNNTHFLNHAKVKLLVLQHFKELSSDFDVSITPLNSIVYQHIDKQISDWTKIVSC